ncbi:MAG: peptidoglycan -binding protein [Stellaceae bacterium]
MPGRSRHSRSDFNIWPGFVDALTQLVMIIIFVVLFFTAGQFYLSNALSGRDAQLAKLNAQINSLSQMLAMERQTGADLHLQLGTLHNQLSAAKAALAQAAAELAAARQKTAATAKKATAAETRLNDEVARRIAAEQDIAERDEKLAAQQNAIAQLDLQIAALRQQLQQISAALNLSEAKNKTANVKIADLGRKLNEALATKVEELAGYRSQFFGQLRKLLGNRKDISIVGDRFMFQSEVLFPTGSATLTDQAKQKLAIVATALKQIAAKIPPDIDWILEVEGYTDKQPISTPQFQSNWELSAARAISVVRFFMAQGIPPTRLSAAGFGKYQPVNTANTPEAYRQNRRIELKLTSR